MVTIQWYILSLFGNVFGYSCLENPMDRGIWQATVCGGLLKNCQASSKFEAVISTWLSSCQRRVRPIFEMKWRYINAYIWNFVKWLWRPFTQENKRCKEQTLDSVGRGKGGMIFREQHWHMYITIYEIHAQSKFYAWNRALTAGALG